MTDTEPTDPTAPLPFYLPALAVSSSETGRLERAFRALGRRRGTAPGLDLLRR